MIFLFNFGNICDINTLERIRLILTILDLRLILSTRPEVIIKKWKKLITVINCI